MKTQDDTYVSYFLAQCTMLQIREIQNNSEVKWSCILQTDLNVAEHVLQQQIGKLYNVDKE